MDITALATQIVERIMDRVELDGALSKNRLIDEVAMVLRSKPLPDRFVDPPSADEWAREFIQRVPFNPFPPPPIGQYIGDGDPPVFVPPDGPAKTMMDEILKPQPEWITNLIKVGPIKRWHGVKFTDDDGTP